MNIIPCATKIIINNGKLNAVITGICIRNESISYEISWFANGDHKLSWVYAYEFEIDTTVPGKAGLVNFDSAIKLITV